MNQQLEEEIQSKGLVKGPRTTAQQIDELMQTIAYDIHRIPDTATIVATAILPIGENNWTLATAYSSAASILNFDEELGKNRALQKVRAAAEQELWKLESYVLVKSVASKSTILVHIPEEDIAILRAHDNWLCVKSQIDAASGLPKPAMDIHHIASKVLAFLGKPDFVAGPIPVTIPRKHISDIVNDEKFPDTVDAFEEAMLVLSSIEQIVPRIFLAVISALKQ